MKILFFLVVVYSGCSSHVCWSGAADEDITVTAKKEILDLEYADSAGEDQWQTWGCIHSRHRAAVLSACFLWYCGLSVTISSEL